MQDKIHTINKQVFEFSCFSYEHAFKLQKEMESGLQHNIHAAISHLLDNSGLANLTARINKIEIDVGEVSFNRLAELLPGKICDGLSGGLEHYLVSNNTSAISLPKEIDGPLETIEIFLLTGSLPWWTSRSDFSIDQAICSLLQNSRDHLKVLCIKNILNKSFIQRLFRQINISTSKQLLDHFPFLQDSLALAEMTGSTIPAETTLYDSAGKNEEAVPRPAQYSGISKNSATDPGIEENNKLLGNDVFSDILVNTTGDYVLNDADKNITWQLLLKSMQTPFIDSPQQLETYITEELAKMQDEVIEMTPGKRASINKICRIFYELKKKVDEEKAGNPFRENEPGKSSTITVEPGKTVINNAGLALIATFLPALFKELQYTENGVFKNRHLQYRAVFVLHFMCTGLSASPEYDLQVNKILCGLGIEDPIPFSVELTEREKQEAEQLLNDIIGHWPALKSGSIDALRGSFLLREALLSFNHGRWLLQAERKGYDILLDHIPWSWKTTKFEWMEFYIETEW